MPGGQRRRLTGSEILLYLGNGAFKAGIDADAYFFRKKGCQEGSSAVDASEIHPFDVFTLGAGGAMEQVQVVEVTDQSSRWTTGR